MTSKDIRDTFLQFFQDKGHKIVPSAPIVNKNDPTLMFTNAGMNPFKDYFLGTKTAEHTRVADTQKCLRVSGKHNDLEDVGIDGYHHTMFEMLGNWSFGDYFKKEAIEWAWELLTGVYKIDKDRLYVTVFGGDPTDGLDADSEARNYWRQWIQDERILDFGRKDNFWEMGDSGPCGPCSEIHIDLRSDADRKVIPGDKLVNADHPDVIEIWNLVFIQFNRKVNGDLESLPAKHVDTGMGFERLCRVIQKVDSNYDTDVFKPFIELIQKKTGISYTGSYSITAKSDIAFRVLVDHIRAVSFTIADGQLPSNTGAGYVIRRILRRAVRYYYSFLDYKQPLLFELVPLMAAQFGDIFPEIKAQTSLLTSVILEEEKSFLRTLESGLKRLESLEIKNNRLDGAVVFELYDTYGFPVDLTRLIASEQGYELDEKGFEVALEQQKKRSRDAAQTTYGDWVILDPHAETVFSGYDSLEESAVRIIRYRTQIQKGKEQFQVVLNITPFYPEGGGQIGDTGILSNVDEIISVEDTVKENDLIIHQVDHLPADPQKSLKAVVDKKRRQLIENNHSATHLMHAALREVLGTHVQQKGSLVADNYLRFDFSHFQKMSSEEIASVESMVNQKIRENIAREEARTISLKEASEKGAMMLFGEKYGETVRMITFDSSYSKELCGGCHVDRTGQIGLFKITGESAVAAGVRRIEAVTAEYAESWIDSQIRELTEVKETLKVPVDAVKAVNQLQEELKSLRKEVESLRAGQTQLIKQELIAKMQSLGSVNLISARIDELDPKSIKNLIHQLTLELENVAVVIGHQNNDKPMISVAFDKQITNTVLHAGNIVKEVAALIKGGGGGQPFNASAGGSDMNGLDAAIKKAVEIIQSNLQIQ